MATPPIYFVGIFPVTGTLMRVTATHGVQPDPDAELVLLDDFRYHVAFDGDQVPGTRMPAQVTVNIGARSTPQLPTVSAGNLMRVVVRAGDVAGPTIVDDIFRAADPVVELVPGSTFPARMTLTLTDVLGDLASRVPEPPLQPPLPNPQYATPHPAWYGRIMQLGYMLDLWIGHPTSWPDENGPQLNQQIWIGPDEWGRRNAWEILTELARSATVNGEAHTFIPRYSFAEPAGYEHRPPDPNNPYSPCYDAGPYGVQLLLAPAGRLLDQHVGLPDRLYKFGNDPWQIITAPEVSNPDYIERLALIDACWTEAPASFTRSRAHAVNLLQLAGQRVDNDGNTNAYKATTVERTEAATNPRNLIATDGGPRARKLDTIAIVRLGLGGWSRAVARWVRKYLENMAEAYLPPRTDPAGAHGWDRFTVVAEAIPDQLRPVVLPRLFPRVPGDGGDGVTVRPFVVYGIPAETLPAGIGGRPARPEGFITRTELRIRRGQLRVELTTTPAQPRVTKNTGSITWADLAPSWDWSDPADPSLTWERFAWVRAKATWP